VVAAVIAGAGVAYELSLMLLGTVTVGSTEQANAIVLGTAMLGMGLGAATGSRLAARPVTGFVRIEIALALLGAGAAPGLYWTWARLDAFWGPLLAVTLIIGACIGAEMPLLAAMNDRLADQAPARVVADYTAADYFGALIGAVTFAFCVRPLFGLVAGTVAVAAVNVVAAAAVAVIVPEPGRWPARTIGAGAAGLVILAVVAEPVVADGRQHLFRDPIIASDDTGIQDLTVTSRVHPGGVIDTRLFLDGDLQLSSVDEYRYHEALVHPAVSGADGGGAGEVLILGGGDCLAAREVLRHQEVEAVTMIELDPRVVGMMRSVPELLALTGGACDDERLTIVTDDAFAWVDRRAGDPDRRHYDAVIIDFPDPDAPALGRLYSVELYGRMASLLRPDGLMVVQCGSPFFAPEAYWTCAATLEAAGWTTLPYHVDVPSFGDWGFHLAARGREVEVELEPLPDARFLDPDVFAAAQVFPPDTSRANFDVEPSTILDPTIVAAAQGAWIGYS
jgi:spermidine synthase